MPVGMVRYGPVVVAGFSHGGIDEDAARIWGPFMLKFAVRVDNGPQVAPLHAVGDEAVHHVRAFE